MKALDIGNDPAKQEAAITPIEGPVLLTDISAKARASGRHMTVFGLITVCSERHSPINAADVKRNLGQVPHRTAQNNPLLL